MQIAPMVVGSVPAAYTAKLGSLTDKFFRLFQGGPVFYAMGIDETSYFPVLFDGTVLRERVEMGRYNFHHDLVVEVLDSIRIGIKKVIFVDPEK